MQASLFCKCRVCGKEKYLTEFPRHSRHASGYETCCRDCKSQQDREYYRRNADKVKDRVTEYTQANREAVRSYQRARYLAHSESVKRRSRKWRINNPSRYAENAKRWRTENPARYHAYFKLRDARVRGATITRFSTAEFQNRMRYFGYRCWICGGEYEHADHVKPISKGGFHCLSNLRPTCARCNLAKGSRWPIDGWLQSFRQELQDGIR